MNTETAYNLALDYLYSFVDFSLKHSSELAKADFSLDRMRLFMAEIGNPQDKYPCIHVAGTKGKGSTSAFCASALQYSGRKVGFYSSPHLQDFTERIQINSLPISHSEFSQLIEELKPAIKLFKNLTTFEITTALAFLHFAKNNVDCAVIEVGLGGRLDATNIITPVVSVITSLSFDHTAVLGNTLTKIAGEKAGIIKPGIPVVSAPQKDESLAVLKKISSERGCSFTLVGSDLTYKSADHNLEGQNFSVQLNNTPVRDPIPFFIPLLGQHQVENAVTAYGALLRSPFKITEEQIAKGFAKVSWPCRFEIVSKEPVIVLDSAHNEDAFLRLAQTVETYFAGQKMVIILGISEDKHLSEMLKAIKHITALVIITRANHPRALEPEKIKNIVIENGLNYEIVEPVGAALHRALEINKNNGSIILSAGSMFVTAEVKSAWQIRK